MEKDQKLSYLMSLGHWEVSLLTESKTISAVYIGKYKRYLLFETTKLFDKTELSDQQLDFKIFMPSFFISGSGKCVKIAEIVGNRDEMVMRFMLDSERVRFKQQRYYKRLPILEKATFELEHQTVKVIVKDISLQGIGLYTMERIRGESGILYLEKNDLKLKVQKVHEFTDFNLFQYGMKLMPDQSTDQLKDFLFKIQKRIYSMDFIL
ncbi:MAG: PilZ domain-containing protein [Thermotogota bacterium]|nr:PilZ domain-containing protein [Thermotogota bacterium]